jgi:hypothetical protein
MPLKVPGIKTKEGLKISGIYGLAISLLLSAFGSDIEPQVVLNSIQEIADYYKESENVIMPIINKLLNLTAVGYLINRVRVPKEPEKS